MQIKDFKFSIKALDEKPGVFEGYASTFNNVDLGDDVVVPGAFAKTINDNGGKVPILWNHDPSDPIGVNLEMSEDNYGLRVKGELNLDVRRGAEIYSLLKQGAIKGLSIGYGTVKEAYDGGKRLLKELRLYEYSVTCFPMNELAQVTAVKTVNQTITEFMNFAKVHQDDPEFKAALNEISSLLVPSPEAEQPTADEPDYHSFVEYLKRLRTGFTV